MNGGLLVTLAHSPVSKGTRIALPAGIVQLLSSFPVRISGKNHTGPFWLLVHFSE
jgi:hypothetical protein